MKTGPVLGPAEGASRTVFCGLVLSFCVGSLPALVGQEVLSQVTGLYGLGSGPHPYFQLSHAGLLYVIMPVVVTSSFILFLFPGAILTLALGQARSAVEWIVFAFGSSLLLSIILSTSAKLVLGTPLTLPVMISLWMGTAMVAVLFLVFQLRKEVTLPCPVVQWSDVRRILWMLGIVFIGVTVFVPKIFWENFNLDGIEAFEFGRSLSTHLLPYWDIQDGVFGFYHNFLLFAYPNHWFITLFGPIEAAARLPFFLYLVVLFAALILLIEWKCARELSVVEEVAILFGLVLYTVVQTYNTNYEPFFADLAEMAATDSLQVVCFLSACYALWAGRFLWFWIFALMTHFATPGGLLLLIALALAIILVRSPDWRGQLQTLGLVILACFLIGFAYETLYNSVVLGGVNDQFSAKNMLRRFYPPTVTEYVRFNALVFSSGILPALFLLMVRRKDPAALMMAVVTLVYFGVLYLQAWTSLHQFTPVMVLPFVVFWRSYLGFPIRTQRWLLPAIAITTTLALFLSLPRHFQVNQATREFGLATSYRIGDYEKSYEDAARSGWSLFALLPEDYRLQYPDQPWGTDPYSWIYYATREKPLHATINYVVQEDTDPSPQGLIQVMSRDGVSVYVRDLEAWQQDRDRELPRVVTSPLYEPILRRTYQFFQAYTERMQQKVREKGGAV